MANCSSDFSKRRDDLQSTGETHPRPVVRNSESRVELVSKVTSRTVEKSQHSFCKK